MPWLFPDPVLPRLSRARACLCSCFLRGTFSSLHSWCQRARELLGSPCVVDEVGLPVKLKKVIFAHFSVFLPREHGVGFPCLPAQAVGVGSSAQCHGASRSPAVCGGRRGGVKVPVQKENKSTSGGPAASGGVGCQAPELVILWRWRKGGKAFHSQLSAERRGESRVCLPPAEGSR